MPAGHRLAVALSSCLLLTEAHAAGPPHAIHIGAAARAMQPGELVVLTITVPSVATAAPLVRAFGHTIPVIAATGAAATAPGTQTWHALVGVDLGVKPGSYTASVSVAVGEQLVTASHALVITPKKFETRTLRVNPAFVDPPPSEQARIRRDAQRLRSIWTMSEPAARWTRPFLRPVDDPANSRFGSRSVFNGKARNPHTGADFSSPAGTPIKAPNGGRVLLAESLYFSGNTIVIDHGLGLFSLFAHLSAFDVKEGDVVEPGALVGRVGATGRVTGPHLHWAVRAGDARIDPLSLLAVLGEL